jgi:hypothetical protein
MSLEGCSENWLGFLEFPRNSVILMELNRLTWSLCLQENV